MFTVRKQTTVIRTIFQTFLSCGIASIFCISSTQADGLQVHGYLSQAYATSSEVQIFGIPDDGTTRYRTMALQFRYDLSENDAFVVQLSHEELGDSPLGDLRDDVELDWAFYERSLPAEMSVRVGRMPIPFGIYNELRDVGTLLEFYRPPSGIYFEGSFSNESIDGIVLNKRFDGPLPLSLDVYYGSWERSDSSVPITEVAIGKVDDALGAQLWIETPIEGLRVGASAVRWTLTEGLEFLRTPGGDDAEVYMFSVDLERPGFYVRGEAQHNDTELSIAPEVEYESWYLQAGLRLGRWGVHALYEQAKITGSSSGLTIFELDSFYDDVVVGATYQFAPTTVAKLEYHDIEASVVEEVTAESGFPASTELLIATLSVSF